MSNASYGDSLHSETDINILQASVANRLMCDETFIQYR